MFAAGDHSEKWIKELREKGLYVSSVEIPGNFLSEGTISVWAALTTPQPFMVHYEEKDIVAFHIIDSFDGTSARGDFMGKVPGVIRPILKWTTDAKEK